MHIQYLIAHYSVLAHTRFEIAQMKHLAAHMIKTTLLIYEIAHMSIFVVHRYVMVLTWFKTALLDGEIAHMVL